MSNTVLCYQNYYFEEGKEFAGSTSLCTPQMSDAYIAEVTIDGSGYATLTLGGDSGIDDISFLNYGLAKSSSVMGVMRVRLLSYFVSGGSLWNDNQAVVDEANFTSSGNAKVTLRGKNYAGTTVANSGAITLRWEYFGAFDAGASAFAVFSQASIQRLQVEIKLYYGLGAAGSKVRISVGGVWLGPTFETDFGLEANWSERIVESGEMARSAGQQGFPQARPPVREISGSWAPVPFSVAYGEGAFGNWREIPRSLLEVNGIVRTTSPCVLMVRRNDASGSPSEHIQRVLTVYGHFTDVGSIQHIGGDQFTWGPFTFRELL